MITPGNTPMVELKTFNSPNVRIFAKCEMLNFGGSIKTRIGFWLVEKIALDGLMRNKTIIEATSGNTGIGIAIACAVNNLKCTLFVPKTTAKEKIQTMKAYGAEVIVVEGTIDDCIKICEQLTESDSGYIWTNQFDNPECVECHYQTTAQEIKNWMTAKMTIHNIKNSKNIIVCAMGTTGTIMGLSKLLKTSKDSVNPNWNIIGVMPNPQVRIEGLKNLDIQRRPKIFNKAAVDEIVQVSDVDSLMTMRELARSEGIMGGPSSGAALMVATQIAKRYEKSKVPVNIVVILPDNGLNYLSQGVYDDVLN